MSCVLNNNNVLNFHYWRQTSSIRKPYNDVCLPDVRSGEFSEWKIRKKGRRKLKIPGKKVRGEERTHCCCVLPLCFDAQCWSLYPIIFHILYFEEEEEINPSPQMLFFLRRLYSLRLHGLQEHLCFMWEVKTHVSPSFFISTFD